MREDRRNDSGAIDGQFRLDAQSVILGPPSSDLFDIPPDYVEASPLQVHYALSAKEGGTSIPSSKGLRGALEQNRLYVANHQAAGKP